MVFMAAAHRLSLASNILPPARGDHIMGWIPDAVRSSIIPELICSKHTGFHSIWFVTSYPFTALLRPLNL